MLVLCLALTPLCCAVVPCAGLRSSWGQTFLQATSAATLGRAVRLAAGRGTSDAESFMAAIAAGDAGHSLRYRLQRAWQVASKGQEEEENAVPGGIRRDWTSWPTDSKLKGWPAHVLLSALDLFAQQRSDAPWRPAPADLSAEQLARGAAAEEAVFDK